MRKLSVLCALALSTSMLAACGSDNNDSSTTGAESGTPTSSAPKETGPIMIGAAVAKSGFMTAYDGQPFQALQLKIAQLNAAGGIAGRKIKIVSADTASDKSKAKAAAEKVLARGAKILIVSCDYDYSAPAAQVGVDQKLLTISLCASSLKFGVQGVGPTAFTPSNSALTEGAAGSEFAMKKGWKKAFQLVDTGTSYAGETCKGFADNYKAGGGTIVGTDRFNNDDSAIASQVAKIKSSGADVLNICSYVPGVGSALRQIRAAGITMPIVANAAVDGTYWVKAVPKLSDFYVPAHISIWGDDPSAEANAFVKDFTKKYGAPYTAYPVFGYVAGEMIQKAVEANNGSTDGEALTKTLDGWKDEPTTVGPTTFTPEQHINLGRPMRIESYTNGKEKFLEMVQVKNPPEFSLS